MLNVEDHMNLRHFLTAIKEATPRKSRGTESQQPRVIEAGDFVIDLERLTASVRGRDLRLSAAEFDLLVFLVGHRRKVVTPRTLLVTRWTPREVHQEDFLPVLQSLRKKLEAEIPTQHYLRTEPWLLCRFEPSAT